jgi:dTDP-4-amino-4,6-dideoxygalactose transaminase
MTAIRLINPKLPPLESVAPYFKLSEDAAWFSNYGPCYQVLNERILDITHAESSTIVANATLALELVLKTVRHSLDSHSRKKYVITPSYTFAATTTSITSAGFQPLYVDVDLDDWHVSASHLDQLIGEYGDQISCLLLCSTFGTTPSLEKLLSWRRGADTIGVPLFIDCAAGFGANLTSDKNEIFVADAVIYSMHATKTFAVGEGGIIVGRKEVVDLCINLSNFGFKADRSFSEFGGNSKISEIMCATALAVLDTFSDQLKIRKELFSAYFAEFDAIEQVRFQSGLENCAWQSLFIQLESAFQLKNVKAALHANEIQFRNDWSMPTHLSIPSTLCETDLKNTVQLASSALTLPLWIGLGTAEIKFICDVVKNELKTT